MHHLRCQVCWSRLSVSRLPPQLLSPYFGQRTRGLKLPDFLLSLFHWHLFLVPEKQARQPRRFLCNLP